MLQRAFCDLRELSAQTLLFGFVIEGGLRGNLLLSCHVFFAQRVTDSYDLRLQISECRQRFVKQEVAFRSFGSPIRFPSLEVPCTR